MLIKNSEVVSNPWRLVDRDASVDQALALASDHLLVPVQLWLDKREQFDACNKNVGVWLDSDQGPEPLAGLVDQLPLIALNFPVFSDGRPFSSAFILRKHLHYKGELRAIGDVQRDPLYYMSRCGFDSFDVSENVQTEDALRAFNDFSTGYQTSIDQPAPLFRRRLS
ncbi:MAG: DUF934 domain-containing protein [Pseudohongiellaceae bacterium]